MDQYVIHATPLWHQCDINVTSRRHLVTHFESLGTPRGATYGRVLTYYALSLPSLLDILNLHLMDRQAQWGHLRGLATHVRGALIIPQPPKYIEICDTSGQFR